eukprot:GHVR01096926.1.p1 GENE.GHVR01096926.1~~GHVR01096926.1.p1  ORF type:complete len:129 (+),score=16.25 GHVR01096926.1:153-539(+)
MREIKFRGKRIDNGEWVYGFLVREDFYTGENPNKWMIMCENVDYGVIPETVGQYTGLKANGVEIYEGDLLSNNFKTDKEVIREVKFNKGKWLLISIKGDTQLPKAVSLYDFHQLNYEVIGNIHDKEVK